MREMTFNALSEEVTFCLCIALKGGMSCSKIVQTTAGISSRSHLDKLLHTWSAYFAGMDT